MSQRQTLTQTVSVKRFSKTYEMNALKASFTLSHWIKSINDVHEQCGQELDGTTSISGPLTPCPQLMCIRRWSHICQ